LYLVWGGADRDVPVSVAEVAATLAPHCTLDVEPDVGHLLPIERPMALVTVIERALA
jgi:pimeloyl-ACP methyl ester carboxylesterase